MRQHVTILAVLHIVLGGIGLLGALFVLVVFGGALGLIGTVGVRDDPDAVIAIPIVGAVGAGLFLLLFLLSIPGIVSGIGLLRLRPWGRILGIIYSALNLMNFPLGAAVGVYGLWVLLATETQALFASRPET